MEIVEGAVFWECFGKSLHFFLKLLLEQGLAVETHPEDDKVGKRGLKRFSYYFYHELYGLLHFDNGEYFSLGKVNYCGELGDVLVRVEHKNSLEVVVIYFVH